MWNLTFITKLTLKKVKLALILSVFILLTSCASKGEQLNAVENVFSLMFNCPNKTIVDVTPITMLGGDGATTLEEAVSDKAEYDAKINELYGKYFTDEYIKIFTSKYYVCMFHLLADSHEATTFVSNVVVDKNGVVTANITSSLSKDPITIEAEMKLDKDGKIDYLFFQGYTLAAIEKLFQLT